MYKCSLRHVHDPVLLPLKVEVTCLSHLPYGVYAVAWNNQFLFFGFHLYSIWFQV